MATWSIPLEILGQRVDQELLTSILAAASVRSDEVRRALDHAGLAWADPSTQRAPPMADLDATAQALITRAARKARNLGGASATLGAAGIPPELVAALVQSLRLCQRLALVYGYDPETELGAQVVWRAMAEAWEVPLPAEGPSAVRLRDLPDVLRKQLPSPAVAASWVAEQAGRQVVRTARRRVLGLIPGLSTLLGARDSQRRLGEQGARAQALLRRLSPAQDLDLRGEEEAVIVG